MKLSTYKCDGCGKLRVDDSNNWWLGKVITTAVLLSPFGDWPDSVKSSTPEVHLCGVQCAIKWAQEQMGKVTEKLNAT